MSDQHTSRHLYDRLQIVEPQDGTFGDEQRLQQIGRPLLAWYEERARILPWREDATPYRVWISEIMLQQTRVEAVKPYFERFMSALPQVRDLAGVPEDRLLKLWEGLGYYNRARNLKKAAQVICDDYGGELPASCEELLKLPGIGSYTAGAIASIAYGLPEPAVDGNVLRVLSRVLASYRDVLKQPTKRWLEDLLADVIPAARASAFNQGLIEIGAIVCIPNGQPKCTECPLASVCLARIKGLISEIPVKTPKKPRRIEEKTVVLIQSGDRLAIRKRADDGLLASLYEFPNVSGCLDAEALPAAFHLGEEDILTIEGLAPAKHIFSHVEWQMTGYRIVLSGPIPNEYITADRELLRETYPIPNAFAAFKNQLD